MTQAKARRGGGVGGFLKKVWAKKSAAVGSAKCAGLVNAKSSVAGGNSSVLKEGVNSLFFSDFFPAAMALHRQQGCWPSKVCVTACASESWRKFSASMEVQASDCIIPQCSPMEQASTKTRINLANRTGTCDMLCDPADNVKKQRLKIEAIRQEENSLEGPQACSSSLSITGPRPDPTNPIAAG